MTERNINNQEFEKENRKSGDDTMVENNGRVTMSQESADMLQRDTLPMRVLNVLMDWIMDGKLKMGDKLNTEDLARQLGVSRMPIREALNSLVRMGLAESIPYVGMRLVTLNQDDIRYPSDLYDAPYAGAYDSRRGMS